jgi:hypothetical protein
MLLSVSFFYHNPAMSASSSTLKKRTKPRGIWKAQRVITPRLPALPPGPRLPPISTSDSEDSDGASTSSTSSTVSKKQRYSPPEHDNTSFWDYSRRRSRYPDRVNSWVARTNIMDTSTNVGAGGQQDQATTDLEDWENLKGLFAQAAVQYESALALSLVEVDRLS